jgi:hypothetical protein
MSGWANPCLRPPLMSNYKGFPVSSSSAELGWESRSDSCIEFGFVSGLLFWFGEFDVMLTWLAKGADWRNYKRSSMQSPIDCGTLMKDARGGPIRWPSLSRCCQCARGSST